MADPFIHQYDRDGNLIRAVRSGGYTQIACLGASRFLIAYPDGTTAKVKYLYLTRGGSERDIKEIASVTVNTPTGIMFDGKSIYLSGDPTGFGTPFTHKLSWGGHILITAVRGTGLRDHKWQRQWQEGRYTYGNRFLRIDRTPLTAGSIIRVYDWASGTHKLVRSVAISRDEPFGVCTDGRFYYVVDMDTFIYVYDKDGNLVRTITTPGAYQNRSIDFDGQHFWCVGS